MRTTLNLNESIIKELMNLMDTKNKSKAVNAALEAYVKEKRIQNLLNMQGKLHLEDNWKSLRELEFDESYK